MIQSKEIILRTLLRLARLNKVCTCMYVCIGNFYRNCEDEIRELFQEFQGGFSSKFKNLKLAKNL
jgi:hypothetical protein